MHLVHFIKKKNTVAENFNTFQSRKMKATNPSENLNIFINSRLKHSKIA